MATLKERIRLRFESGRGRAEVIVLLTITALAVAMFAAFIGLIQSVPETDDLRRSDFNQATIVYTSDGQELARYYDENRSWVPLDSIADVAVEALVATEDRRFYEHSGIDFRRTFGAAIETISGERQGGSTITMQVVRNSYPEVADDVLLKRKAKEWLTALQVERQYSKEEILETYLNTVPFNYNAFGIDAAARTYFGADPMEIDTLQAATLVGMLKGTTIYNPIDNPEDSRQRRNVVLQQMVENGSLSQAAFDRLSDRATEIDLHPLTPTSNLAPYFARYVRGQVEEWAAANGYNVYRDGLRVYTTLDAQMQEEAEKAVREQLDYLQDVVDVTWSSANVPIVRGSPGTFESYRADVNPFAYFWQAKPEVVDEIIRQSTRYRELTESGASEGRALEQLKADGAFVDSLKSVYSTLQAGLVAMDPDNGHVKAWVGGRDFELYRYDHVYRAKRQPGSTFKPFVYAAALEDGYSPLDSLRDSEVRYVDARTNRVWTPSNFGSESGQMMALRDGLALSKNTVTARLTLDVGPERVADVAHRMGIESELQAVPSLGLGTSDVTLLEMVSAYSTIAAVGTYTEPVAVTRIENADGRTLASFGGESREAVRPQHAYTLLDMMRGVVDYGTGVRIRSNYGSRADLAGKTGTTQRGADGWFMLVHPDLVIGSWVGFPSPSITFRTRYWGQGSHNALRVVGDFYQSVSLASNARFSEPPGYETPEPSRLRAADTSGVELPDLAFDDEPADDRLDDTSRDTSFAFSEDGLPVDSLDEIGPGFEGDDTGDEIDPGLEGDEDDPEPESDEDGEGFGEIRDDEAGEDAAGESDEEPEAGQDEESVDEPAGEPSSEADRLNRQERQGSELDEHLDELQDDDGS